MDILSEEELENILKELEEIYDELTNTYSNGGEK